jgi:hypothetical protein
MLTTQIIDLKERIRAVDKLLKFTNIEEKNTKIKRNNQNQFYIQIAKNKYFIEAIGANDTLDGDMFKMKELAIAIKHMPMTKDEIDLQTKTFSSLFVKPIFRVQRECYNIARIVHIAIDYMFPNVIFLLAVSTTIIENANDINNIVLKSYYINTSRFKIISQQIFNVRDEVTQLTTGNKEDAIISYNMNHVLDKLIADIDKRNNSRNYVDQGIVLFTELAQTDVHNYFNESLGPIIPKSEFSIILQILISLYFINNVCNIVHMDSHSGNFLLSKTSVTDEKIRTIEYNFNGFKYSLDTLNVRIFICDFCNSLVLDKDDETFIQIMYTKYYRRILRSEPTKKYKRPQMNNAFFMLDVVRILMIYSKLIYQVNDILSKYLDDIIEYLIDFFETSPENMPNVLTIISRISKMIKN